MNDNDVSGSNGGCWRFLFHRIWFLRGIEKEEADMRLKDTGLTAQDIKDKVNKYMIETYERFDFLAETAKDQYVYDENGDAYLDFYAGIAVNSAGNCNEKVVKVVQDQVADIMHTFNYPYTIPQALLAERSVRPSEWTRFSIRTPVQKQTKL